MLLDIICSIGLFTWCVTIVVHILALYRSFFYLYSWRYKELLDGQLKTTNAEHITGVSIIKTISSDTANVLWNLESVFKLKYPKFELLICIQSKESPIILQIENMMKSYPHVDAKLFTGALEVGVNPKINNMLQCYDFVKYQYVWICDSNIIVHDWSLHELSSHLKPNVGFVHQLPFMYSSKQNDAGHNLEKMYFGGHHARWYLVFDFLRQSCTNGMSSIFDKKLLDEVGGLKAFSNYLAEDHFMGLSFYERNYKLVLSTEPALQSPQQSTIKGFVDRMTRWQKLRLTMLPTSLFEPLIECFVIGIIGSLSLQHFIQSSFVVVFVSHVILWCFSDQILCRKIEKNSSSLSSFPMRIAIWFLREMLTYYTYLTAVWDRRIKWSKGTFNLGFGGKATSLD